MSTIKANDIQNASGGIPTVKGQRLIPTAWVNFNGSPTVAVIDSENVSSVTDVANGLYTINFGSAMASAVYVVAGSVLSSASNYQRTAEPYSPTTTSVSIKTVETYSSGRGVTDKNGVSISILGGQA